MVKLYTKLYLSLILLLFASGELWAQEFEWAKRTGFNLTNRALTTDKDGNLLLAGHFRDSAVFTPSNIDQSIKGNGIFVTKYNSNGELIWIRDISDKTSLANVTSIVTDKSGNYWLTGGFQGDKVFRGINNQVTLHAIGTAEDFFIAKYSKDGELSWAKSASGEDTQRGAQLELDAVGNAYVVGYFEETMKFSEDIILKPLVGGSIFIAKYRNDGKLLWVQSAEGMAGDYQSPEFSIHIAVDSQGEPYISGTFIWKGYFGDGEKLEDKTLIESDVAYNNFLVKYSRTGKLIWVKKLGVSHSYDSYATMYGIAADLTGNICISGYHNGSVTFEAGEPQETTLLEKTFFLNKYDSNGKLQWISTFEGDVNYYSGSPSAINIDKENSIYLAGNFFNKVTFNKGLSNEVSFFGNETEDFNDDTGESYIAKYNSNGDFAWAANLAGGKSFDTSADISIGNSGKIYITGIYRGNGEVKFGKLNIPDDTKRSEYEINGFLCSIKDSIYKDNYNVISGNIYVDTNSNCQKEITENFITDIIIKAEPGPIYTSTDESGNYKLYLGKGNYTISQLQTKQKGKLITQTCPSIKIYSVNFDSYGKDTTGFNFGNKVTYKPYLNIDIASDRRRRCFRSTTTISYKNEGYVSANDVQVKVILPPYVVPVSSSIPWSSRKDSVLIFNIGVLEAGASRTITLIDSVICGDESIRGLTQCTKAIITPANDDETNSRWDQSSVALQAACKDNGFVRLAIQNTGVGHMADSAVYRIYLDAVQVFSASYKLRSGDSLILEVPVNGKTIRLEADQRPYHPGNSQPSITIEGCGGASAVISKGFVDVLPQDDAAENVEISCMPIMDSYDPNDKTASPAGVTANHIITDKNELEYLIRFQNTGNDVAYNITIEDVLDEDMDIATLQIGASSHPFTWKVSGEGLPKITWTFNNINLPDSASNEPGSHAFVKFKIAQKADNPIGTVIKNQANIYFDFNSAITTNETVHTVGELPVSTAKIVINACGTDHPSEAKAGNDIILQQTDAVNLQADIPLKGYGSWKLIKGSGNIADNKNATTSVSGLSVGENIFEWSVTVCDEVLKDSIRVERVVIPSYPAISLPAPYCAGEKIQAITATGNSITWYGNATLTTKVGQGNIYQPVVSQTDTLYVTQQVNGYESPAKEVVITIKPRPAAPHVDLLAYSCAGNLLAPLVATGDGITWYADESLKTKLGEGNQFNHRIKTEAIFVTQQIDGCESIAAKVIIQPGGIDYNKIRVANILTPNGDNKNDTFSQPQFPEGVCIGDFRGIQIYNRWGKTIFESKDPHFAWTPISLSNGVYFYSLQYSNFNYTGSITILH